SSDQIIPLTRPVTSTVSPISYGDSIATGSVDRVITLTDSVTTRGLAVAVSRASGAVLVGSVWTAVPLRPLPPPPDLGTSLDGGEAMCIHLTALPASNCSAHSSIRAPSSSASGASGTG